MGGHAAIHTSLHDGITLPCALCVAGFRTDLGDATEVASCRMYRSPRDLWNGLARNAGEALASPALIGPAILLLIGGQMLPVILLALVPWLPRPAVALTIPAAIAASLPRLIAVGRFRQSLAGAVLHPNELRLPKSVNLVYSVPSAMHPPP